MKTSMLAIATLSLASTASYSWEVSVDGPDVFDKIKVVATEGNLREALVVQCDSESEFMIACIFRKKEFENTPEVPAKLFLKWSDASPVVLDATLRDWNDSYGGVVVSGREPTIMTLIAGIRDAKAKIQVGVEILGNKESAAFSSRGSKKAMNAVLEKCKLQ